MDNPEQHEIAIAKKTGVPRSTLKALRRSGQLVEGQDWTVSSKTVLYTPPGVKKLAALLGLPPVPETPQAEAVVNEDEPKNAPTVVMTFRALGRFNWTICTAVDPAGKEHTVRHGWRQDDVRRLIPGRSTITCYHDGECWRRVLGVDRLPVRRSL